MLPMLDVAIGLTFIYALLSIICSAAKESLEARFKTRAKNLENGLRELLQDPTGTGACQKLWNHPLVSALFPGTYDHTKAGHMHFWFGTSNLPSYLPAGVFSRALMDLLFGDKNPAKEPHVVTAQKNLAAAEAQVVPAAGQQVTEAVSQARADLAEAQRKTRLKALIDSAPLNSPRPQATETRTTTAGPALASGAASVENQPEVDPLKTGLKALVDQAQGDPVRFQQELEAWFNARMERLSGVYKRWTNLTILLLALAIALLMNVDTIAILERLSTDEKLRSEVVAMAMAANKERNEALAPLRKNLEVAEAGLKTAETTLAAAQKKEKDAQNEQERTEAKAAVTNAQTDMTKAQEVKNQAESKLKDAEDKRDKDPQTASKAFRDLQTATTTSRLPIGWQKTDWEALRNLFGLPETSSGGTNSKLSQEAGETTPTQRTNLRQQVGETTPTQSTDPNAPARATTSKQPTGGSIPKDWMEWVTKIVGLLLTAFAISFGAPFWFDLLNRFVSIRSALQPATQTQTTTTTSTQGSNTQTTTTDRNPGKPPVR